MVVPEKGGEEKPVRPTMSDSSKSVHSKLGSPGCLISNWSPAVGIPSPSPKSPVLGTPSTPTSSFSGSQSSSSSIPLLLLSSIIPSESLSN